MSELPILFSGPMIIALLDGRKTQTRRVIKPQFPEVVKRAGFTFFTPERHVSGRDGKGNEWFRKLRYATGDRLWVRETWASHWANDDIKPSEIVGDCWSVKYVADGHVLPAKRDGSLASNDQFRKSRPSIFMPRWASRLTLAVTNVRVERLQDISEEDAKAEGASAVFATREDGTEAYGHRIGFHILWNSLNAKRGLGWDKNPWVAAYTFTVHHANIDALETSYG